MPVYLDENNLVIERAFGGVKSKIIRALNLSGIKMDNEAKEILTRNSSNITMETSKGIYHNVLQGSNSIILTFGCNAKADNNYPYPGVIEYGRRPNRRPPPMQSIKDWLLERSRKYGEMRFKLSDRSIFVKGKPKKKMKDLSSVMRYQNSLSSLAFIIARNIGKKGIKEKPFMRPAFKMGIDKFLELMNQ